ncbi:MAG: Ornithine carbamoyltransferase [Candidatus Alkanophagales archaeon MCA70_species_2]|nr:Ornithine carbamoyltransferase [Candidatus Alkanophaga liquidiphilum]
MRGLPSLDKGAGLKSHGRNPVPQGCAGSNPAPRIVLVRRSVTGMHFISMGDLTPEEIEALLEEATKLKAERAFQKLRDDLKGRILGLIFEKPSTRTRVSFEVAMLELGGHALYLNWNDLQLGRGERIKDTARVLSAYLSAVMIRAFKHETVVEFAAHASIPVINGLTNLEHPCQTLADLLTIKERKGRLSGLTLAWIGDGNNVCNSLLLGAASVGMNICVACPKGYEPPIIILKQAKALAEKSGTEIKIVKEPVEAAADADVLYTDVWVSMGDEAEREPRLKAFRRYQINERLLGVAKGDAIVMHCMPAHVGEEITEDVIESTHSAVYEQAENRLHAQKALLLKLLASRDKY